MGVIAKGILRGCQGLFTPVSFGYPLSVFNKNSTLKHKTAVGNNVGEGIKKKPTQIWLYLCGFFRILFISIPNLPPLRDSCVY